MHVRGCRSRRALRILIALKISATIITFNEAENMRAACESVSWADEILVVDSRSTDATREIARECGARVIEREWPGFPAQKQIGPDATQHEGALCPAPD